MLHAQHSAIACALVVNKYSQYLLKRTHIFTKVLKAFKHALIKLV